MSDLVEAQTGHDAELFRGESQKGLKPDFDECKYGTENAVSYTHLTLPTICSV